MKEILGDSLEQFFSNSINGKRTYKGDRYEVWEVSDETFRVMCDMSEEEFVELAGEEGWWRCADGSNLGTPNTTIYINGHKLLGWADEDDEDDEFEIRASNLSDYFCEVIGASQPRNVCAVAIDLAKYNNITMGELFTKCKE